MTTAFSFLRYASGSQNALNNPGTYTFEIFEEVVQGGWPMLTSPSSNGEGKYQADDVTIPWSDGGVDKSGNGEKTASMIY